MADECALVVDDSRLARSLLSKMLKRYKIHVDLAERRSEPKPTVKSAWFDTAEVPPNTAAETEKSAITPAHSDI